MRVLIIFLALALSASNAWAQTGQTLVERSALQDAYGCADISDGTQRVSCYDEAIARVRQAERAGDILVVDRAQVSMMERDAFGFSFPSLAHLLPQFGSASPNPELADVELQVERLAGHATGRYSFIMTNGQVWTQTEQQSPANVRAGDIVHVRRTAMGGYMLSPRHGAAHRVRREG